MQIGKWIIWTKKRFDRYNKMWGDHVQTCIRQTQSIDEKSVWVAINPVVHSLEELKKNTWDKDRVEQMQKWLKDNFEPK